MRLPTPHLNIITSSRLPSIDHSSISTNLTWNGATETNGHVDPGVSIRFGPVKFENDVEMADADAQAGAASKRKSRNSVGQIKSYAEPESSEEDQPLVRHTYLRHSQCSMFNVGYESSQSADFSIEQASSHVC